MIFGNLVPKKPSVAVRVDELMYQTHENQNYGNARTMAITFCDKAVRNSFVKYVYADKNTDCLEMDFR